MHVPLPVSSSLRVRSFASPVAVVAVVDVVVQGFMSEVYRKYNVPGEAGDSRKGPIVFDAFQDCFNVLPLASLVEKLDRRVRALASLCCCLPRVVFALLWRHPCDVTGTGVRRAWGPV